MALRSETAISGLLAVGDWPGGRKFRGLAQVLWSLEPGKWSRREVRFRIPAESRKLGVFVYLPNDVGTRVWLDAARLETRK